MNISLHKEFAFGEDKSFDVRGDFFNALNKFIFNAPEETIPRPVSVRVIEAC